MRSWLKAVAGLAAGWAYVEWMDRRNARRPRPRLRDADGEAYPEHHLRLAGGAEVSLVDVGSGPPLVLVPGADGVKETFRYQLPDLAADHRVVTADLRSEFRDDARFEIFADDLRDVMWARGVGPAFVLGQSLGGAVAMAFALRYPELVRGLVLSNTLARVSYEHVGLNRSLLVPVANLTSRYLPLPVARLAARGWSELAVWVYDDSPGGEKAIDYALEWGPRTVPRRVGARRVELFRGVDLRPSLPRIEAPALVVKGPRDAYCPPAWSREIAALIPRARYVEIPGTGHCSHVTMPGRFNGVVRRWLREVGSEDADGSDGAEAADGKVDPDDGVESDDGLRSDGRVEPGELSEEG